MLQSSVVIRPQLGSPPLARYFDVEDLQASAAEFAGARERLLDTIRHSAEPASQRTQTAVADLLRQTIS